MPKTIVTPEAPPHADALVERFFLDGPFVGRADLAKGDALLIGETAHSSISHCGYFARFVFTSERSADDNPSGVGQRDGVFIDP